MKSLHRPIRDARLAGPVVLSAASLAALLSWAPTVQAHAPLTEDLRVAAERVQGSPEDPDAYLWRATLLFDAGDLEGARSDLAWAGLLAPDRIEVVLGQIGIALRSHDAARAMEALERFLAAQPARAEEVARRALAVAQTLEDEFDEPATHEACRAFRRGLLESRPSLLVAEPELHSLPIAHAARDAVAHRPRGGDPVVTRGPYHMSAAATSIVVRWRTDAATESWVRYGSAPSNLTLTASDPNLVTEHELTITGLSPDTRYYYGVGTSEGTLAGDDLGHFFSTAPPLGVTHPTRIWLLGDSGGASFAARGVRDAFYQWNGNSPLDFVLLLGDNAYDAGTDAQYQAALFDMYPVTLARSTIWTTRGNHDLLYSGGGNDYYDLFSLPRLGQCGGVASHSEAYYAFNWGTAHFICLDSEGVSRAAGGSMMTWLGSDLAANTSDWTICFWHHPPYTHGSHDSDDPEDSDGRMKDMRENALPILDSYGVDLVLCGHSHGHERSFLLDGHYGTSPTLLPSMILDGGDGNPSGDGAYQKSGLGAIPHSGAVYDVVGSSSRLGDGTYDHPVMVSSERRLGSGLLSIDGLQLEVSFIDTFAVVRDRFVMTKHGPAAVDSEAGSSGGAISRPNPFADATRLRFELAAPARVRLSITDASGRLVRALADELRPAGPFDLLWDGRDEQGRRVPRGLYLARLQAGERVETLKILRSD